LGLSHEKAPDLQIRRPGAFGGRQVGLHARESHQKTMTGANVLEMPWYGYLDGCVRRHRA
ncbi:hypothetical protein ACWD25_19855, partial [Streptomyces sp. NPDC002920]